MIDFATVSREFRSVIHRRVHVQTFLGSVLAATGLFLQNVLKGSLPARLQSLEGHVFTFYALMVMVPTSLLALRMARLHGGMVLNGILFARLMQEQSFTRKGDPVLAARHNFLGVSFLQFLLTDLIAGLSAAVLLLSLGTSTGFAVGLGGVVFIIWLLLYLRFHHQAAAFAFRKIGAETCGPVEQAAWREHISTSLEDANTSLLSEIGFVGLVMFSAFEKLSGLGEIRKEHAGAAYDDIQLIVPWVYTLLMVVTCLVELIVYIRVRVAIGTFSLQLDPTDRPFRPLRLTDSLLGYLLLAFLFTVSFHMLLLLAFPRLGEEPGLLFGLDGTALLIAIVAEQATLVVMGRRTSG
jgi:hypothetical protein